MIVPDVNILIYAFHSSSPGHAAARSWLEGALTRRETVAILDVVATGFLRMMTNPRLFSEPLEPAQAMAAIEAVLGAPNAVFLRAGESTWGIFGELVELHKLRAHDIPDAWIAAAVMSEEATLLSDDTGFGRFRELQWVTLADLAE